MRVLPLFEYFVLFAYDTFLDKRVLAPNGMRLFIVFQQEINQHYHQ